MQRQKDPKFFRSVVLIFQEENALNISTHYKLETFDDTKFFPLSQIIRIFKFMSNITQEIRVKLKNPFTNTIDPLENNALLDTKLFEQFVVITFLFAFVQPPSFTNSLPIGLAQACKSNQTYSFEDEVEYENIYYFQQIDYTIGQILNILQCWKYNMQKGNLTPEQSAIEMRADIDDLFFFDEEIQDAKQLNYDLKKNKDQSYRKLKRFLYLLQKRWKYNKELKPRRKLYYRKPIRKQPRPEDNSDIIVFPKSSLTDSKKRKRRQRPQLKKCYLNTINEERQSIIKSSEVSKPNN